MKESESKVETMNAQGQIKYIKYGEYIVNRLNIYIKCIHNHICMYECMYVRRSSFSVGQPNRFTTHLRKSTHQRSTQRD